MTKTQQSVFTNGSYEVMPTDLIRFDDPGDYLLDADGNELRNGDKAIVLQSHWPEYVGRIVEVTSVSRSTIYENRAPVFKAWSPDNTLNRASIKRGPHSLQIDPRHLRKADPGSIEAAHLLLADLLEDRAAIDTRLAALYIKHGEVSQEIDRYRIIVKGDDCERR